MNHANRKLIALALTSIVLLTGCLSLPQQVKDELREPEDGEANNYRMRVPAELELILAPLASTAKEI